MMQLNFDTGSFGDTMNALRNRQRRAPSRMKGYCRYDNETKKYHGDEGRERKATALKNRIKLISECRQSSVHEGREHV